MSISSAHPTAAPSAGTITTIFRRLLPLLTLCYVLSFLDRTNIGMVKKELEVDLGIGAAAYGLGAGLFFISYALCEIPSNLILQKVGARWWIARIMITWGVISACMAFVQGPASFYVLRLLLGAAEAGLYPGVLYYITRWFPHAERAKANGIFLMGAAFANILGAPLAGLLLGLHGFAGMAGWQWLFIIEGLPSCLLAVFILIYLPDRPTKARWLEPSEAQRLEEYIAAQDREGAAESGSHSLRKAVRDPQVVLTMIIFFCIQIATYAMGYFLPAIISGWGDLSKLQVGLLTAIPYVFAALGVWFVPRWARPGANSKMWIFGTTLGISLGLTITMFSGPILGLVGFCITLVCTQSGQPLLMANVGARLRGTGLAGGLAAVNMFGLTGGFVGPYFLGYMESRTGDPSSGVWMIIVACIIAAALVLRLRMARTMQQEVAERADARDL